MVRKKRVLSSGPSFPGPSRTSIRHRAKKVPPIEDSVHGVEEIDNASDDLDDGKHIKLRFSTGRVAKFVKTLTDVQKGHLERNGLGFVLHIKKFRIPVGFLEWVMDHTFPSSNEFNFKEKRITFTSDMVTKVLGIPSGREQVVTGSKDFEVEALVEDYKAEYRVGHTYLIKKCLQLIEKEEDEEKFLRHFMLFLISSVLVPGKGNTTCVEYLYSLLDMKRLAEFDWADRILYVIMREVKRFRELRSYFGRSAPKKEFYMQGCLPLLAVIYIDFLDLPYGNAHLHKIDRKSDGFHSHYYGVRDFRDISYTPYRTLQPLRPEPSQNMYHNDVQKIVNKQKALWKDDLPCIVHTLQDIFENRLTSIASDFNALYMSKIEELSSNGGSGPSVSAVAAPSIPATLIVPSSSNVEQQAAIDDPIGVKDKSATIDDPVEDSASGDVHSSPSNSDSGTSADEKTPPIDTSNIEHSVSNMNISANDCLADGSADTSHIASAIPATNLDSAFKSVDDLDTEIGIAMSYASPIHETETVNIDEVPSLGPSTIDLKNRKKRKATVPNAPCEPLVVQVDDEIQDFYTTYVQKKSLAASKMPYFVKHQDFHLTYEEFQKPLKQRLKLSDALMVVCVNVFNGKPEKYVFDESECKKICFSPSFGKKMLIKPQLFQTRCCIGELRKAHNLLKINTADLIFFPILVQEHWVLICINVLYGTLNFFDSANITSDEDKERMLHNVATNFSKVCPEAGVSKDGFEGYRTDCTTTYPMQTTLHDCG